MGGLHNDDVSTSVSHSVNVTLQIPNEVVVNVLKQRIDEDCEYVPQTQK